MAQVTAPLPAATVKATFEEFDNLQSAFDTFTCETARCCFIDELVDDERRNQVLEILGLSQEDLPEDCDTLYVYA